MEDPSVSAITGAPAAPAGPAGPVRRTRPIYRVFVSSTWLDLQPERRALLEALQRMEEMRFVGMEFFGNRPETTHEASLDQVGACDVFMLVVGGRYGSGITDAEYEHARTLGLPCFVYFKRGTEESADDPARHGEFRARLLARHTVKEFASPEELAANAAGDLHNWVAARWIEVAPAAPGVPAREAATPAAGDRGNLLRLLEHVEADWIRGVLDGSLHRVAWLDLGLDWRDDAVERPWDRILIAPDRPVQTLRERDTIAAVFGAAQSTLLVLGEPGAGKTTTLLELARELVARARRDEAAPVPVVLALTTWSGRHKDLLGWLVEEMNARYQVPARLGRTWLEAGRLALLLDGLDEVREDLREGCAAAINRHFADALLPGLAVTCRVAEYGALREKLRLRAAICLQPLNDAQIDAYFARAGAGLDNLRRAMTEDAELREVAKTPLMLSVMTLAWRDASADEIRVTAAPFASGRRRQLLEAYVQSALRRRTRDRAAEWSDPEMLSGLGWLADGMKRRGLTLFSLEHLQPDWLEGRVRGIAYFAVTRLLVALAFVVPFALQAEGAMAGAALVGLAVLAGLLLGGVDLGLAWVPPGKGRPDSRRFWLGLAGLLALTVAWIVAVVWAGTIRHVLMEPSLGYLALLGAGVLAPRDPRLHDIHPAVTIEWSWRLSLARGVATFLGINLLFGAIFVIAVIVIGVFEGWQGLLTSLRVNVGMAAGLGAGLAFAGSLWAWKRPRLGARSVMIGLAVIMLCTVLGIGIAGTGLEIFALLGILLIPAGVVAVFGGFTAGVADPAQTRRGGAWFWVRVPLLAALGVGVALLPPPLLWHAFDERTQLLSSMDIALRSLVFTGGCALLAFVRFGGFNGLQHYVLRRLLQRPGGLPRRPAAFLAHAARINLLQKVGSGYRFVHALLLDHLAGRRGG